MKNLKTKAIGTVACIMALGLLTACGDDDSKKTDKQDAQLSVINASPGSDAYYFKVNGANVNDVPLAFSKSQPYKYLMPDNYEISVNKDGNSQVVTQTNLNLKSGEAFSVYLSDVLPKLNLVVIKDDLTVTHNKAKVRFVNMSSGNRKINLVISGQSQKLVNATAFKGFSLFNTITPAKEISFELRDSQTDSLLATLPNATIEAQKFYTLWGKDIITSAGVKQVGLGIIVNK